MIALEVMGNLILRLIQIGVNISTGKPAKGLLNDKYKFIPFSERKGYTAVKSVARKA